MEYGFAVWATTVGLHTVEHLNWMLIFGSYQFTDLLVTVAQKIGHGADFMEHYIIPKMQLFC